MKDDQIDYSDIPELDASFFANADIKMPNPKKTISIRIDDEVLSWYKASGPGYQTRMNAVLKAYMEAQA